VFLLVKHQNGASYPGEINNYAGGNTAQWMVFSVAIDQLMSSAPQRAFPCYRGTRGTAERVPSRHRSPYRSKLDTPYSLFLAPRVLLSHHCTLF